MGLFDWLFGKATPAQPTKGSGPFPPLSVVPLDYNRWAPDDVEGWRGALDNYGFVVLSGVLSQREVEIATSLLWDLLERLTQGDRTRPSSWEVWPDESFRYGMIQGEGTHCEGMWYIRGLPGVREAFAQLFGTRNLHVSFDGFPALRPLPAAGSTVRDWYHIDHAVERPGRWLAQGLVVLTPSDKNDGGLVVWPCSHRVFATAWENQNGRQGSPNDRMNDFAMLKNNLRAAALMPRDSQGLGPIKVCARPGDLVLWDSRTVHCNAPLGPIPGASSQVPSLAELMSAAGMSQSEATEGWGDLPRLQEREQDCGCPACQGQVPIRPSAPLGRLGAYVCMQPADQTTTVPEVREALLRLRHWTGHAPFRDVFHCGAKLQCGLWDDASMMTRPLPTVLAHCRQRRTLAGLSPEPE